MKLARLRQTGLSALAILLISGAGIAFAGNSGAGAPASGPAIVPAATQAAEPTTEPTTEPIEPGGQDTDTLQEGDQTAPDSPAEQAAEAAGETEKAGAETEKAGAEEPGDENLPGGGHADDPNDPSADHQFEGVE